MKKSFKKRLSHNLVNLSIVLMISFLLFLLQGTGLITTKAWAKKIDTGNLYEHLKNVSAPYKGQSISVYLTEAIPPNAPIIKLSGEFTEATEITVKFIRVPYPASFERFLEALQTGSGDVVDLEGLWSMGYESYTEALNSFLKSDLLYSGYNFDDFFKRGAIEHFTVPDTGKIYAIPTFASLPLFWYVPKYFQDAGLVDNAGNPCLPNSMRDYYDFAKKLTRDTDGDGKPEVWGSILSGARTGIFDEICSFYWSSGGEIVDERLHPSFDNQTMVNILSYYQKIWKEGYAHPDSPICEVGPVCSALAKRTVAFGWNWSIFASYTMSPLGIKEDPHDPMTLKAVPFPVFNPDVRRNLRFCSFGLAISKFSSAKEAAFLFVQWATSPEIQHMIAQDYYTPDPPRKSIYDDPEVMKLYPHYPYMKEALEKRTKAIPRIKEWVYMDEIIAVPFQRCMLGEMLPEMAARRAAKDMEKELEAKGYYRGNKIYPDWRTGRGMRKIKKVDKKDIK